MPTLLDRMPFFTHDDEIVVRGERVRLRSNQIILWVSLTRPQVKPANPTAIPFPVILDTGHTHGLALQERHLIEWGGLRPDVLPFLGHARERGQRVPLREVNIWVHPNVRGVRDELAERSPHLVEAQRGIAVYPAGDFPRLPLLGLRAIAENALTLNIDGAKRTATLRTSLRWWPFG